MDDFIHNLRTSKRFDRNRKPHDGKYPGSDKPRYRDPAEAGYLKSIADYIPAFGKTLEGIAESWKQIADAAAKTALAEERKADAMESIAAHLKGMEAGGNRQENAEHPASGFSHEKEPAPKRKPRAKAQPLQII
jgi:hypothetical protein